jgi:hypothetical protein
MSYSISRKGASKALALAALAVAFDEVVASQPVHAKDKEAALKQAEVVSTLIEEPSEGEEVYVSLSGSLSWREEGKFTNASINAYAAVQKAAS